MNPILELKIWDQYCVQKLKIGGGPILIVPLNLLDKIRIPEIGEEAHLDIVKNGERIRIGQIDIIGKRELPLGRITPDVWARHLGPGYEDEYIEAAKKEYGTDISRFSYVQIIELEIKHLDTKFLVLQENR